MIVNDYNKDFIDVTYQGNEYLLTQVDMTTYINSDFYGVVEIHSLVAHICTEYGDDIRVMVDDKFIEQLEKQLEYVKANEAWLKQQLDQKLIEHKNHEKKGRDNLARRLCLQSYQIYTFSV